MQLDAGKHLEAAKAGRKLLYRYHATTTTGNSRYWADVSYYPLIPKHGMQVAHHLVVCAFNVEHPPEIAKPIPTYTLGLCT